MSADRRNGWISLRDLPAGAAFETEDGARGLKTDRVWSTRPIGSFPDSPPESNVEFPFACVELGTGKWLNCRMGNLTMVREIPIADPTFPKAVRTKIPLLMEGEGMAVAYAGADKSQLEHLKRKLLEEAAEVWRCDSGDSEHFIEELADVLEVVDALRQTVSRTKEDLAQVGMFKRERKGGFLPIVVIDIKVGQE